MENREDYYIEKLTVGSWMFYLFPYFLRKSRKTSLLLHYVDASHLGLLLSCFMARSIKAEIKRLDFSLFDAKDQNGDLLWWKVAFEDLVDVQKHMREHPEFRNVIRNDGTEDKMLLFVMRRVLYFDLSPFGLTRILLLIRVASSKQEPAKQKPITMFFLSSQRPWLTEVGKWAQKTNVHIIPMGGGINFSIPKIILQFGYIKYLLKQLMYYWMAVKYKTRRIISSGKSLYNAPPADSSLESFSSKIAVEFYGHLNLFSPNLHSDLFFIQQSNISKQDVLIYFQHPDFLASDKEWNEIKKYGMSAVVINSRAAATPHVPVFNYRGQRVKIDCPKNITDKHSDLAIRKYLYTQITDFHQQRDYWINFITRHNIKMHVSWYKYESSYLPLADALHATGGVGVVYQRSFEHASNSWTVSAAEVVFGFSKLGAHLGKDVDSIIPYYVVTGYLGDHRFPLVQKEANGIKGRLRSSGAKRIITYFDESSVDDDRWNIGHKVTQENYAYLLNKVLETPWLGLIFKPKKSSSLRKRLGDAADFLRRAQETGRCFVFEEGNIFGSYPPAAAALAADVAIHGHFFAATAGVESALTGTPTLMLDREGFSTSPLYKLSLGRVIFKNWDDLWKACQDHWNAPQGMPGFGDWSSVINDIDPFRDGRAAERMGTYLEWIMEGFKAKLPRETILADAAERYSEMWGKDKVFSINCDSKQYASVN